MNINKFRDAVKEMKNAPASDHYTFYSPVYMYDFAVEYFEGTGVVVVKMESISKLLD